MLKIKQVFIGVLCIFVLTGVSVIDCNALSVSAEAAVLMCADTGEVLYSRNGDKRLSMASTTKIMSAHLLIGQSMPEKTITVTKEMTAVEGTSMGLLPGDTVTYDALVCGMLLSSGNDAALTTAISVAGSEKAFAALMNKRATEIGMKNTNFVTASGLDSEEHYSTAYDMALLGCEAISDPRFKSVCSDRHITVWYGNPPYRRTLSNHNRLLDKYEYSIGIKTGFTKKSGRCLVSAAQKDSITLVAVTLNAPDDWNDHIAMFGYGFSVLEKRAIDTGLENVHLPVTGGERESVSLMLAEDPTLTVRKGEILSEIRSEVFLKPFEYAPIKSGMPVGRVVYSMNGKTVFTADILTAESVSAKVVTDSIAEDEKSDKISLKDKLTDKIKEFFNKWHSR